MTTGRRPLFANWRAVVLHRPHPFTDALRRQLELLDIRVRQVWPQLDDSDADADVVFFDADTGHDGQFPWPAGYAPMPMIALIGSETPGRVEWALAQGANSHLLKPIGSTGAYSALLIAAHAYENARTQAEDIRSLQHRINRRPVVVRAILKLMEAGEADEAAAMKRLRAIAMDWRITIEEAAETICKNDSRLRRGA